MSIILEWNECVSQEYQQKQLHFLRRQPQVRKANCLFFSLSLSLRKPWKLVVVVVVEFYLSNGKRPSFVLCVCCRTECTATPVL